ncbi:pyridoxal-5'-phosphate-dependent protein subunit beta [Amycolatopsis coloradensis]|uniref:Pyridoxal-5'-phosphate-dependent protein subunit beta n=1 Tax=Amycolatopsis coloradensis TaxID=76021 RepID=A0A1R0KDQ2_9PSEU|nr:pyridoxal-phosphate dependent enzyme [Amycolatopsis coloradensis]OLZ43067.1 pyridoxal-5'-phosphate-dependent protein subunit beta [Amycolatopsis coloradensis]
MIVKAPWLGAADVVEAAHRTAGRIRRTPLLPVGGLPHLLLKAEHLQHGGSFKTRGAANAMLDLAATHVVTGSSGNHGIAVARLGAELGVGVTVVVAGGARADKAAVIAGLGAQVLEVTGGVAQRDRFARDHAADIGAVFVPSSDHRLVVAGAGTVGMEVFAEIPDLDAIFVPTGGGGLLAGVCLAAEGLRGTPRIVGVEPVGARRYARSLAAGYPVEVPPSGTVADGLRGQRPGAIPFPIIQRRVDELVEVTDEEILAAMDLLHRNGVEAEPSGSAAFAGALRARFTGRAVAIVSGGNTPRRCRAADTA